jgi:hypothetical protein
MVRLASSRRSPSLSRAERRRKTRLSQNSTCEKNSRCRQPASSRSLAVKKGVRCASLFRPQVTRSRGMSELASACRRSGAAHLRKALASCLNPMRSRADDWPANGADGGRYGRRMEGRGRPCQPSRRAPAFTMTATARPLSRSALTRWLRRRKATIRPNAASARFDGSGFRRTGGHAGLSTKARDASRSSRVRGGRVRSGRVSSGRSRCLLWHSTSVRNNTSHRQAVVPPQRMRHSIGLASRTESEILAQKSDVY